MVALYLLLVKCSDDGCALFSKNPDPLCWRLLHRSICDERSNCVVGRKVKFGMYYLRFTVNYGFAVDRPNVDSTRSEEPKHQLDHTRNNTMIRSFNG